MTPSRQGGSWTRGGNDTGQAPQITHKGQYYPLKADLDRLCEETKAINANGSKFAWIEKEKDALPQQMAGKRDATKDLPGAAQTEETEVIESEPPKEVTEELAGAEEDLDI